MKKSLLSLLLIVTAFLVSGSVFGSVRAGFLKFDRSTVTVASDGTFTVDVIVDAGSDQISSMDAYVNYDATLLQAQSVTAGTFFPTVTNNLTSGKVYIAGLVDDPATSKTGSGTVATISFKALKDGTGSLAYDCQTGQYNTSKIIKNDLNATNVIQCSQNMTSSVSVGASNSNTPSTLPQTGTLENLTRIAIPGAALLLIGGILKFIL